MRTKLTRQPLHIPAFVNFTCQACGRCCREYEIAFSEDEFRRLSAYHWEEIFPALKGKLLFAQARGRHTAGPHRFRLKEDQTCVFLREDGKCLMHLHVGEENKALACRMFPLTFAHTPAGVYVGCRFSCWAMAEGVGEPLELQRRSIEKLLADYEEAGHMARYGDEVQFDHAQRISWGRYLAIERALLNLILRPDIELARRLLAAWRLMEILREANLNRLRDYQFDEFLELVLTGAINDAMKEDLTPPKLRWTERSAFNQLLFLFHRRTPASFYEKNWPGRMAWRARSFLEGIKFLLQRGEVELHGFPRPILLRAVEEVRCPSLEIEGTAMIERYLAGKLFGKQVFGRLFFDYSFVDGFTLLLAACGAVFWYARAAALAHDADKVTSQEISRGIQYVDHCYGYSLAPSTRVERLRVWTLSQNDHAWRVALRQLPQSQEEIERPPE